MRRKKGREEEEDLSELAEGLYHKLAPMRPDDFDELPSPAQEYIIFLENKREDYEQDGLTGMYHSLNSQLNKLSREIRDANIHFSDDKNSKIFERFLLANKEIRTMLENIDWLRLRLGLKEEEVEEKKKEKHSPIESRAK